jgi:hypothetical protein
MDNILNRPIVLMLNVNVRTPRQVLVRMATNVATALDINGENMVLVCWTQWIMSPFSVAKVSHPVHAVEILDVSG